MRVKVIFNVPMTKNGVKQKIGDSLEIDATQALLLAKKGVVKIPGYKIEQETRTIDVDVLIPENEK